MNIKDIDKFEEEFLEYRRNRIAEEQTRNDKLIYCGICQEWVDHHCPDTDFCSFFNHPD